MRWLFTLNALTIQQLVELIYKFLFIWGDGGFVSGRGNSERWFRIFWTVLSLLNLSLILVISRVGRFVFELILNCLHFNFVFELALTFYINTLWLTTMEWFKLLFKISKTRKEKKNCWVISKYIMYLYISKVYIVYCWEKWLRNLFKHFCIQIFI